MKRNNRVLWIIFAVLVIGLLGTGWLLVQALMAGKTRWLDWFLPMLFLYTLFNAWHLLHQR